MYSQTR